MSTADVGGSVEYVCYLIESSDPVQGSIVVCDNDQAFDANSELGVIDVQAPPNTYWIWQSNGPSSEVMDPEGQWSVQVTIGPGERVSVNLTINAAGNVIASTISGQSGSDQESLERKIAELEARIVYLESVAPAGGVIPPPMNPADFDVAAGFVFPTNGIPIEQTLTLYCRHYTPDPAGTYVLLQCGWLPYQFP